MIVRKLLFLIAVVAGLVSCKDELTLPAEVDFKFGMVPFTNDDAEAKSAGKSPSVGYAIDHGEFVVEAIEFDGRRDQGKDVYFISNLSQKIVAELDKETTNIAVKFDVPQGSYNRIDIILHLGRNSDAPLVLIGNLNQGQAASVPIRFEFGFADEISIRAKAKSGTSIVISRDKVTSAMVVVDTEFLFRFINPRVIALADMVDVDGVQTLLINHQRNVSIFNQVASRFHNSISVVFE